MLFTFPSRYWSTIGLSVVFSLAGWSPLFPAGFLVSCGTQVPACIRLGLRLRGCHPLRPGFPAGSADLVLRRGAGPTTPSVPCDTHGLGSSAFARHYSRNHCYSLFLQVLRCFSSLRSLTASQCAGIAPGGFPHSDIRGSRDICSSPRLFAACHVLLRLREPRHPPYALLCFPFSFRLGALEISLARVTLDRGCLYLFGGGIRSFFALCLRLRFSMSMTFVVVPVVPGRVELPTSTLSV